MEKLSTLNIKELLRGRELRATSSRIEVLSIIANHGSAIPYTKIQQSLKDFDRVTLYRILLTLIEKGIIHKASVSGTETYYAVCNHNCSSHAHNHEHIHFKCEQCNEVSCVQIDTTLSIAIPNFSIQELNIEAKGICESCNEDNLISAN